jgi:hypothetical protein
MAHAIYASSNQREGTNRATSEIRRGGGEVGRGKESYPTQATMRRTHEESEPQPSSIASGSPSKERAGPRARRRRRKP